MKIVLISLALMSAFFSMNGAFADEAPTTDVSTTTDALQYRNPAGAEHEKAVGHNEATNPGQGVGHTEHGNGYGFGHHDPVPTPTPTPLPNA